MRGCKLPQPHSLGSTDRTAWSVHQRDARRAGGRAALPAAQQAALNAVPGPRIIRVSAAQVAVRPYLLYARSSREGSPSGRAQLPTASPPPTAFLGSVDMELTAIGANIQVPS